MRVLSTSVSVLALALLPLAAEAAGHAAAAVPVAPSAAVHALACSAAALGSFNGCYAAPDRSEATYQAPEPESAPPVHVVRRLGEGPLTVEKSAGVTVVRGPGSHHAAP